MSAKLATVAEDPTRLDGVGVEELRELIGETMTLLVDIGARLIALTPRASAIYSGTSPPSRYENASNSMPPDHMLTVNEAAERLGVSRRWMYRKADELPFTVRLTSGTLRFSEQGLERWKESKRGGT